MSQKEVFNPVFNWDSKMGRAICAPSCLKSFCEKKKKITIVRFSDYQLNILLRGHSFLI
jgi:hypothetical protein